MWRYDQDFIDTAPLINTLCTPLAENNNNIDVSDAVTSPLESGVF